MYKSLVQALIVVQKYLHNMRIAHSVCAVNAVI